MLGEYRPTRPFKSLDEFRRRHGGRPEGPIWPCLTCRAQGWYPIFTEKGLVKGFCPTCSGKRTGSRKACEEAYRQAIDRWQAALQEWRRIKAIYEEVRSRLTEEELEAIRIFT